MTITNLPSIVVNCVDSNNPAVNRNSVLIGIVNSGKKTIKRSIKDVLAFKKLQLPDVTIMPKKILHVGDDVPQNYVSSMNATAQAVDL